MKTTMLPEYPDAKSPAGADIRFLMDSETGNMIHITYNLSDFKGIEKFGIQAITPKAFLEMVGEL